MFSLILKVALVLQTIINVSQDAGVRQLAQDALNECTRVIQTKEHANMFEDK